MHAVLRVIMTTAVIKIIFDLFGTIQNEQHVFFAVGEILNVKLHAMISLCVHGKTD